MAVNGTSDSSPNSLPRGLGDMCSPQQTELLDAIDRLRLQGVSREVSLPQIIVCGDQSSGKSSVLEAISGVGFPVKATTCTRFPTEVILRRKPQATSSVSIVPHEGRSKADRERLQSFVREIGDFGRSLETIIEEAKVAMVGKFADSAAFSRDLLRIEVNGPDRPHLTIVDLPGLIHSATGKQTEGDVELIKTVVCSYMKEPRSIILAVVSAKNDINNQIVLQLAAKADPEGRRTLGVITKPDTLHPGSESEKQYVALARNEEKRLELGWHVLRNRDSEKHAGSRNLAARDTAETEFFATGAWERLVAPTSLGVNNLRPRLSELLLQHIAAALPGLLSEIESKIGACDRRLRQLGRPRGDEFEQRRYLLEASQTFQTLVRLAVDGAYSDPFFDDPWSDAGYQKRFRAIVQNLGRSFARDVGRRGHRRLVGESPAEQIADEDDAAPLGVLEVTRDEYLDHIVELMRRTHGRELPGTFNPMIIATLFAEQSQPWRAILTEHVQNVWEAAKKFTLLLAGHALDDEGPARLLYTQVLEGALKTMLDAMNADKAKLLKPHEEGHPITYNHYFTDTISKMRAKRKRAAAARVLTRSFGKSEGIADYTVDLGILLNRLSEDNQECDMEKFAASEALDCLDAYYKVAMKRFIDDVAVQLVEATLVQGLPKIFTPMSVSMMSPDLVSLIAGETPGKREERDRLERQLGLLQQGLRICKRFDVFRDDLTLRPSPLSSATEAEHQGIRGEAEPSTENLRKPDEYAEKSIASQHEDGDAGDIEDGSVENSQHYNASASDRSSPRPILAEVPRTPVKANRKRPKPYLLFEP